MPKRNWTRWWKWGTIAAGTLVIGGVLAGWLLFQHIPDWYRPPEIPPDQVQSVRDDFVSSYDRLSGAINTSQGSFEFRLRQDQVNAWLASREQMWPDSRKWLPAGLQAPQIVIGPDGIRVAAAWRQGNIQTVVSGHLDAQADENGITIRLLGAAAGSLPIPRSQVEKLLHLLDQRGWRAGQRVKGQIGDRPLPALGGLYDGVVFPNAWIWQNGRQPFKVIGVSMRAGEVVLTLEPLPRQAGRRSEAADDSSIPIWNISPGSAPAGRR